MIQIVQGFKLHTREAVDSRLVLSKIEMRAINDNKMPDKYFAVCKDDGCLYLYDKSTCPCNSETGKFIKYSSSKIDSITINGVEIPIENRNIDIPLATAERYGIVMLGKGLKSVDGVITLDFNSIDDESIPFEKLDLRGLVIDGTSV